LFKPRGDREEDDRDSKDDNQDSDPVGNHAAGRSVSVVFAEMINQKKMLRNRMIMNVTQKYCLILNCSIL
jgi:hypothetical protein